MSNLLKEPKHRAIIALDFDKNIADSHYPAIHKLFDNAKEVVNFFYDENIYIIINTCRNGKEMEQARQFLIQEGVKFDKINEQHPYVIQLFGNDTRKISADFYVDDKDLYAQFNPLWPNWLDIKSKVMTIINSKNFTSILHYKL